MPTISGPRGRARRLFRLALALPLFLSLAGGAGAAPYLAVDLATGFVPDKRALRPLIRFKAAAQDWKLEFERAGLRSGTVIVFLMSTTAYVSATLLGGK